MTAPVTVVPTIVPGLVVATCACGDSRVVDPNTWTVWAIEHDKVCTWRAPEPLVGVVVEPRPPLDELLFGGAR